MARFGDPGSAKDLLESDSRVLYTASLANPGAGYLMYLRAGNLLAQPFDPRSLRVTGEAMPVVNKVYSFQPTGAADFSVSSSGAIAYQSFASRSQLVGGSKGGADRSARRHQCNQAASHRRPKWRPQSTMSSEALRISGLSISRATPRELTLEPGIRRSPSLDRSRLVPARLAGNQPRSCPWHWGTMLSRPIQPNSDADRLVSDGRFIVFENIELPGLERHPEGRVDVRPGPRPQGDSSAEHTFS